MVLVATLLLLLQDPAATTYLNRICRKLSPEAAVRFVNDPEVKAAPLPGSRIEISTGLFSRLQNEAALAGILAHEIAHTGAATGCVRFVKGAPEHPNDRENERQADEAAIQALIKAGYDPNAMLEFFSKYRREGTDLPVAYSAEDLLIEKLQIEARDHPLKDVILNTPEFDRVHESVK